MLYLNSICVLRFIKNNQEFPPDLGPFWVDFQPMVETTDKLIQMWPLTSVCFCDNRCPFV